MRSPLIFLLLISSSSDLYPERWHLFFSLQSFWKTRFRINRERGFLIRLVDEPYKHTNWRSIYHCTERIEQPHLHLWELRRRWRNNCWLKDRYSTTQALSDQNEFENTLSIGGAWKEVQAKIFCEKIFDGSRGYDAKCICRSIPVSQTVLLPDFVVGFNVSILNEGTTTTEHRSHIIGFDLISADARIPNITLGYRLPGSQVTINFYGRHLRGFAITTGNSGIRALRPVWNDKTIASWIGDWEHAETSTELVLKDDVKAISAKFDVSHFSQSEPRIYVKANMN